MGKNGEEFLKCTKYMTILVQLEGKLLLIIKSRLSLEIFSFGKYIINAALCYSTKGDVESNTALSKLLNVKQLHLTPTQTYYPGMGELINNQT